MQQARGDARAMARRMWRDWVRPHRASLAVILLLVLVVAGTTALYPLLINQAFDAFATRDREAILLSPILVILVTAAKGFSLLGQSVLTNRVVTRIEADMQTALYAHLVDADMEQAGAESPAMLTQRFTTDFTFVREALTRLVNVLVRDTATMLALVAVLLWIDWQLTLIAALVTPFVARPIARVGKTLRRVATATQEQTGAMAGLVSESLSGARVAKTYALEGYLKARAARAFDEVRALKMKSANARARLDPLLEVGAGIAVAGVLAFVGLRIADGRASIGDFTGFVTALLLAAQPVRTLGNLNAVVQEALSALHRIFAVMDERPRINERPGAPPLRVGPGEIRFEGVAFAYAGGGAALNGADLVVPGGRTTALVGRSGSGKSTLMALVPRLFDPASGRVTIDGQDVGAVGLASLRSAVAVVAQEALLFDDTVRANILFGRAGASHEEVVEAARAAAAHDFIGRLPQGYETRVGDRGGRLSGGERQRVALARAFLKDAPILLLDEATSALDAESERLVQDALARLMRGRTTLVIAHRLATIRHADAIAVMDGGRVAETGSHAELIERGGLYARLHRLQFAGEAPGEGALLEAGRA